MTVFADVGFEFHFVAQRLQRRFKRGRALAAREHVRDRDALAVLSLSSWIQHCTVIDRTPRYRTL